MTYDAADNASKSYDAAIEAMREKLSSFRREQIGDCTLYLGDCRDILPLLPKVDAVVTDPPYGIGAGQMSLGKWRTSRMAKSDWDKEAPDLTQIAALDVPTVIWGGNYFPLPPSRAFLVWDKGAGFKGRDFAECEMAWCSWDANARIFAFDPLARGEYRCKQHPTQKPVQLMRWCLQQVPDAKTILDPFMGSGTTGAACARMGRRFIGIEIDETYFNVACLRISGAYAEPDLFVEAPAPAAEQLNMLEAK